MIGSVLHHEMVLASRRNRSMLFRWIYLGWLVAQMIFLIFTIMIQTRDESSLPIYAVFALFAQNYYVVFVVQHFLIVVLMTPALTAGAITDEKSRGTLQYLLTADFRPGELVAGKFLGRSYHVLFLVLMGLPFICFIGVFGGLDGVGLLSIVVNTLLVSCGLGAASILASVWCRQTRDAVLGLYTIGGVAAFVAWWFAGSWISDLIRWFDPWTVLYIDQWEQRGTALVRSAMCWLCLTVGCLTLASWRLTKSYIRQLEQSGSKRSWWSARRPTISDSPVQWKEQNIEGVAPLHFLRRLPRWLGMVLVVIGGTFFAVRNLLARLPPGTSSSQVLQMMREFDLAGVADAAARVRLADDLFFWQGLAVTVIASMVVAVRCSGAVTGEREKGTWGALLMTPLPTAYLIRGKLWGILNACWPYLIAYAAAVVPLSMIGGIAACTWTILWLIVTALAMAYGGSVGLWCSVRSKSSWRSLLATLLICYLAGGAAMYVAVLVIGGILALFIYAGVSILQPLLEALFDIRLGVNLNTTVYSTLSIGMCIALGVACWLMSWRLLLSAEKHIGTTDRSKEWEHEPLPARFRRRFLTDEDYDYEDW